MSRMRIVQIIDRLVIGGPTDTAISLASELDPSQFSIHLISGVPSRGEADRTADALEAGIKLWVIADLRRELGLHDVRAFFKILRALFRLKPDVVHTHKSKAGTLGRLAVAVYKWATPSALLWRPRRCKVVHTFHGHVFHGYFSPSKTTVFLAIERFLGRFCTDCIITLSQQQQKDISEKYRIANARKVAIIPLPVEIDERRIRPGALRAQCGLSTGDIVVGTVGRLCEIKNFPLLLRAFARAKHETSLSRPLRLVIVGDGHLRKELEDLTKELQIEDVVFTGFRADARTIYCDFDLVALSSINEGTPSTLIEAMLHSRPFLATYVGGVPDLMGSPVRIAGNTTVWEHGLTVRSGDVDAFAEGIKLLAEDFLLRDRMGKEGKEFARTVFSKRKVLAEVATLYRKLTSSGVEVRSRDWHSQVDYEPCTGHPMNRREHSACRCLHRNESDQGNSGRRHSAVRWAGGRISSLFRL